MAGAPEGSESRYELVRSLATRRGVRFSDVNASVFRALYSWGTAPTGFTRRSMENETATPLRAIGAYATGSGPSVCRGREVRASGLGLVRLAAASASSSLPMLSANEEPVAPVQRTGCHDPIAAAISSLPESCFSAEPMAQRWPMGLKSSLTATLCFQESHSRPDLVM